MGKADRLSRRPDWQKEVKNDNQDQMLIKPGQIKRTKTLVEENKLREKIKKAQGRDEKVVKAVEELKKIGMKTLRDEEWMVEEGIVMKEE